MSSGTGRTKYRDRLRSIRQIKKLLELNDKLKPASKLFPAHIHAMGEEAEEGARSLIQLIMLDYSKGTGDRTVSVSAHINPEEVKFIYSTFPAQISK